MEIRTILHLTLPLTYMQVVTIKEREKPRSLVTVIDPRFGFVVNHVD